MPALTAAGDHCEVLLRARAIEGRRSRVIDPWVGTVIAQTPDRIGIIPAELDLERVTAVRRRSGGRSRRWPIGGQKRTADDVNRSSVSYLDQTGCSDDMRGGSATPHARYEAKCAP